MWPRLGTSKLVTRWITLTLAASIVSAFAGGALASWTALEPARVWRGELWRLVTWPFIESSPVQLVVTCIAIYKFGNELAIRWGDRRLRRFMAEILISAAVATCLLAAISGQLHIQRLGGWAAADVLVIAWARQFPAATLTLYGMLPLHGRDLVRMTVAIAVVFAIFLGFVWMAPELAACTAAALYPQARLRR
jgi:membrane associated rhomboid family serine protease